MEVTENPRASYVVGRELCTQKSKRRECGLRDSRTALWRMKSKCSRRVRANVLYQRPAVKSSF